MASRTAAADLRERERVLLFIAGSASPVPCVVVSVRPGGERADVLPEDLEDKRAFVNVPLFAEAHIGDCARCSAVAEAARAGAVQFRGRMLTLTLDAHGLISAVSDDGAVPKASKWFLADALAELRPTHNVLVRP